MSSLGRVGTPELPEAFRWPASLPDGVWAPPDGSRAYAASLLGDL